MPNTTLKDALLVIAYDARIQILTTPRRRKQYSYMFNNSAFINREILEKHYPELLDREMSDGIHGEGSRDGVYIHLYED